MPLATEIQVEQNTPEWHNARLGLATASCMNSVFAKGKDGTKSSSAMRRNYRIQLALERVTGQPVKTYKSASMEQGNELEETAALFYELHTSYAVRKCGFFKHNDMALGASPDRLVTNANGTVQIKCPEPSEHRLTMEKRCIPAKYYRQCVTELLLTEKGWLDFASYNGDFPENAQLVIVRLERSGCETEMQNILSETSKLLEEVDDEVAFIENYNQ